MPHTKRLIGIGAFLALAVPSQGSASAVAGFHTPGWAAQCVVATNFYGGPSPLVCDTPNDGFYVKMNPYGKSVRATTERT